MKPRKIQNMTPKEIRRLLFEADVSQVEIARAKGVQRSTVYKVIEGQSVSDPVRQCLAEKVGVDIKRIWPDPYLYGAARKRGRPFCGGQHQVAA